MLRAKSKLNWLEVGIDERAITFADVLYVPDEVRHTNLGSCYSLFPLDLLHDSIPTGSFTKDWFLGSLAILWHWLGGFLEEMKCLPLALYTQSCLETLHDTPLTNRHLQLTNGIP